MINKAGSNFLRVVVLLLALSMVSCALKRSALVEADRYRSFAPDGVPFVVADSAWNVDMRGNHRAVVKVTSVGKCNAVEAVLPWRRPDTRRGRPVQGWLLPERRQRSCPNARPLP